jgi:DHA1 family bicyclomycin/chloramphenicol resistance-like MFS transporter
LFAVFVTDFQYLQLARVLQGIAACATSIVVFSAVRDSFSNEKSAHYYSYLNGVICVIPALAPTLGGLLALQFGWRSTFLFMVAYAVLVLLVVVFKLPETRPKNTVTTGALYRWSRYQPILSNSHFVFYATACMIAMASILTYVSYAPSWVIKHLGLSEMTFSYLFGVNAIINIGACFIAPWVIKKLGKRHTVLVALGMMIASALVQLAVQALPAPSSLMAAIYFMSPMLLLCIGFALLLGPATSMALSGFGERAGTAAALLGCIQMSGAALLTGVVQQTNLTAPYASALVIGGGAMLLLVIMSQSRFNHWHYEQHVAV